MRVEAGEADGTEMWFDDGMSWDQCGSRCDS